MRIVWNEQSTQWFRDASRYTGYNRELKKLLLERIPHRGSLCDIGCGAGLIDLELAPCFDSITCVDISPAALSSLEADIREQGISNITVLCADGETLMGQWDTVLALFHGGRNACEKYFRLMRKQLILVTHSSLRGSFGPEANQIRRCFDVDSTRQWLDEAGVRYHLTEHSLEYGQPFHNRQDARAFLKAYTAKMTETELERHMDTVLVPTGDREFPYYLPKKKEFGMFLIRRDENKAFGTAETD